MGSAALDELISQAKAVMERHSEPTAIVERVVPIARRAAADRSWIAPEFFEADEEQGFSVTVLHEEADHTLMVSTVCWLPGRGVAPHDHQTWGVVVGLDGAEHNFEWRRLDDGSKPGHAEIVREAEIMVGPGDAVTFMPDDIHSVSNSSEAPTLSLHIYGRSLTRVDRHEFDPARNTVRPCPQRTRRGARPERRPGAFARSAVTTP